ncbi:type I-B CRISPR-associated protein Cas8b1/Cst1, partial [bacterium]|nr:type I-B CRISPR-associated protein Cas8b1/Cst1 [bacterium]
HFAAEFLQKNRRNIHVAQSAGDNKVPESKHRLGTLLIGTLLDISRKINCKKNVSITAYHLSNSGQGPDLNIYHLPMETCTFLQLALTPRYSEAWQNIRERGWEIIAAKKKKEAANNDEPRYNILYEDLLNLPDNWPQFVRRYFLRIPKRQGSAGDPGRSYSLKKEWDIVSWELTDLFLQTVVSMNKNRIDQIRKMGDSIARYIGEQNDRRLFQNFLNARGYDQIRSSLIKVNLDRLKAGKEPIIDFENFIEVFEESEETPFPQWRLYRDLVLIRIIDKLHESGWIQSHVEEIPEVDEAVVMETET